jgi:hypothetical protein
MSKMASTLLSSKFPTLESRSLREICFACFFSSPFSFFCAGALGFSCPATCIAIDSFFLVLEDSPLLIVDHPLIRPTFPRSVRIPGCASHLENLRLLIRLEVGNSFAAGTLMLIMNTSGLYRVNSSCCHRYLADQLGWIFKR